MPLRAVQLEVRQVVVLELSRWEIQQQVRKVLVYELPIWPLQLQIGQDIVQLMSVWQVLAAWQQPLYLQNDQVTYGIQDHEDTD